MKLSTFTNEYETPSVLLLEFGPSEILAQSWGDGTIPDEWEDLGEL